MRPPLNVTVSRDCSWIELDDTERTRTPGRYGFWFADDSHAVVGDVVAEASAANRIRRAILTSTGLIPSGPTTGRLTGHVYPAPSALPFDWNEIDVPSPLGPCPAWVFPAAEDSGVWAIHIHGRSTTRVTTLRGVPVAHRLGFTSLVVSYRGDGEAPTDPTAASGLGTTEWQDVASAIDVAVSNGARSIVLFGWSLGGAIALRAAERTGHRELIEGIVLVGPLTSWSAAIGHAARHMRLPRGLGRLLVGMLSTGAGARLAGADEPYRLEELDWTAARSRLTHPTLVLHNRGDAEVPFESSLEFARRHPGKVDVVEFPPTAHCMEWNAEPAKFEAAIVEWWARARRLSKGT
ncbi:alpha/beta hydrolase family protein [Leifsonia sp. McL0607]|uniref:alpha/beta hydrolase family protein n=1 Tax=Leifsonia sp. McL0607 TaxID=3415672 RepID=UPI003CEA14A5